MSVCRHSVRSEADGRLDRGEECHRCHHDCNDAAARTRSSDSNRHVLDLSTTMNCRRYSEWFGQGLSSRSGIGEPRDDDATGLREASLCRRSRKADRILTATPGRVPLADRVIISTANRRDTIMDAVHVTERIAQWGDGSPASKIGRQPRTAPGSTPSSRAAFKGLTTSDTMRGLFDHSGLYAAG